jgi:hypothetical protein
MFLATQFHDMFVYLILVHAETFVPFFSTHFETFPFHWPERKASKMDARHVAQTDLLLETLYVSMICFQICMIL